jgi:hypothetical protein
LDISFHAELANHLHLIVRSRPDVAEHWSDQDVARRWLKICRLIHSPDGQTIRPVTEQDVAAQLAEPDRAQVLRERLSSVSYFMKALCEHVARRANGVEGISGSFWESRFKCRHLAHEAAILVCGVYVDLNQIRAGEALTPEESTHTSAHDRIQGRLERRANCGDAASAACSDGWLCEFTADGRACAYRGADVSTSGRRASDQGLLPIQLDEYLELLDWTGRAVVEGKRGAIPVHLAPILDRLAVNGQMWLELVSRFEECFSHVVGQAEQLVQLAARAGRRWFHGRAACAAAFG